MSKVLSVILSTNLAARSALRYVLTLPSRFEITMSWREFMTNNFFILVPVSLDNLSGNLHRGERFDTDPPFSLADFVFKMVDYFVAAFGGGVGEERIKRFCSDFLCPLNLFFSSGQLFHVKSFLFMSLYYPTSGYLSRVNNKVVAMKRSLTSGTEMLGNQRVR